MERRNKPLKRITVEESLKYTPAEEDFYSNVVRFYTITPTSEGWDEVTYFTKKLRKNLPN